MAPTSIDLDQELPELGADRPAVDAEIVADLAAWDVQQIDGDLDVDAGLLVDAAAFASPPERVRFTAPLQLRQEGVAEAVEGSVVNLSVTGLACVLAAGLEPGERVWAEFALGLGEAPLHLLCEVIWRQRSAEAAHSVYGLRFLSMTDDETRDLDAWVRERAEGRAGAWPLPVLPNPTDERGPRGASPWLTAAAGMAAGIGLALLLSVLPSSSIGATPQMAARHPLHPLTPMATPPAANPSRGPVTAQRSSATHASGTQLSTAVPDVFRPGAAHSHLAAAVDPGPRTGGRPAAAESQHGSVADEVAVPAATAASSHPRQGPLPRRVVPAPADFGTVLHPVGAASQMRLSLLTDGSVDGHVAFWLSNPRRLVIDVPHRKSGFAHSSYAIDHPLATRLRIGNHPDKVRFVIEVAPDVAPRADIQEHGDALDVVLHRR